MYLNEKGEAYFGFKCGRDDDTVYIGDFKATPEKDAKDNKKCPGLIVSTPFPTAKVIKKEEVSAKSEKE